jgi:hypothetical protein
MSASQFDNGYWYAAELRAFAADLGIPLASKLRKDELEKAIKQFLTSGKIKPPARSIVLHSNDPDSTRPLSARRAIVVYKNDKATWDFVEREAQRLHPGMKRRSGARYRLNRWREAQIEAGKKPTYGDLAAEYARLSVMPKPFAQIPQDRYVNFLSDFFAAEKGATRKTALQVWAELKRLDLPKNYRAWADHRARSGSR